MSRPLALGCLLLAAVIWGLAFIAQKSAMDVMEPLTFIAARFLLGGVVILPLALIEHRRATPTMTLRHWLLTGFLAFNFFMGAWLQQAGLLTTTITNGGFLTGLYVFFVPLILLLVFRTTPHRIVWGCAPVALLGIYLLNGGRLDAFAPGDGLVMASAVFWALHVLMLGLLAAQTRRPILVSSLTFIAAGVAGLVGALIFEEPSLAQLGAGGPEILYAGLMSTAIGFTLQAIGQQHVAPANAAIILSSESLFAALGGALVMGDRLVPLGYVGAAMIFAAIVLVETIPAMAERRNAKPTPSG